MIFWKIEKRKLCDLKPHKENPRKFTNKGMKDLESSINCIGYASPIVINTNNILVRMNANTAGQWDWDILANEFELNDLNSWGLNVPELEIMPNYDLLDDTNDNTINSLSNNRVKAIEIKCLETEYEELNNLVNYWRKKGLYVGKYLIDKLQIENE